MAVQNQMCSSKSIQGSRMRTCTRQQSRDRARFFPLLLEFVSRTLLHLMFPYMFRRTRCIVCAQAKVYTDTNLWHRLSVSHFSLQNFGHVLSYTSYQFAGKKSGGSFPFSTTAPSQELLLRSLPGGPAGASGPPGSCGDIDSHGGGFGHHRFFFHAWRRCCSPAGSGVAVLQEYRQCVEAVLQSCRNTFMYIT